MYNTLRGGGGGGDLLDIIKVINAMGVMLDLTHSC